MFGFTGNNLKELRSALVLTQDKFAEHLKVKAKYLKKAERLKDEEIPIDGEFHHLFENICYTVPRMIAIRFDHMRNVQQLLQGLARKLQKVDTWLNMEKTPKEEQTEDEEKEERQLSETAIDKRSVLLDDE